MVDTRVPLEEDGVSRVQQDLANVCEHLFVSIGSLQRDAPPQSLQDEDIWNSDSGKPDQGTMEETARSLGVGIRESLDALKCSIDALPDGLISTNGTMDSSEDMAVLVDMVEKNTELEKDLEDACHTAEDHARRVERVHGAIVDALLHATGCLT